MWRMLLPCGKFIGLLKKQTRSACNGKHSFFSKSRLGSLGNIL